MITKILLTHIRIVCVCVCACVRVTGFEKTQLPCKIRNIEFIIYSVLRISEWDACFLHIRISLIHFILQVIVMYVFPGIMFPWVFCFPTNIACYLSYYQCRS